VSDGGLGSTLDGSPTDAAIYAVLMVAGLVSVFRRRSRAIPLFKANGPLLIFFFYCLISTLWSPFHGPAFKRWTKDVGDLIMVVIVVTDAQPLAAIQRLYSRLGFVLFPFSVVLIRYTDLGRGYDPDGNPMNTGITTNKNALGLIVFLVLLGTTWQLRALFMDRKAPSRTRRLVAQGTLFIFGIALLEMAHCATAVGCFVLGTGLMLATNLRAFRNRPGRVHALCLGAVVVGGLITLFGGVSVVTSALGRNSDLGRTDIWRASMAAADSPIFGTGYESFWNANVDKVAQNLPGYWHMHGLVSAHNGYIQIYLDLGWVGVGLIAAILMSGYRRAARTFGSNPQFGGLILAYIATSAFYNITEAGFRVLTPSWIFLLLALFSATAVGTGLFSGRASKVPAAQGRTASSKDALNKLVPDGETVYATGKF